MVKQLTSTSKIMLIKRGSRARRNAPQQSELRVQPDTQTFSHMWYRGTNGAVRARKATPCFQ